MTYCSLANGSIHKFIEPLYHLSWAKKGVLYVGGFVKPNIEVMKPAEIKNIYRLKVNDFYHYRIKSLINLFMKKQKKEDSLDFIQPSYPVQLKTLIVSKQGCQKFYQSFNNEKIDVPVYKWRSIISTNNDIWKIIFRMCFKSILDNSVIWFQYKIPFNILPTRDYLFKINLSDNNVYVLS